MDDIASELGISKKTIYQHFKDKDEIVSIATRRRVEAECDKMEAVHKNAKNAVEHLYLLSLSMREAFSNMNSSALYDLKKYHKNAWNIFLDYKQNVIYNEIVETLQNGIKEGYFRQEINISILAKLRLAEIQMSFDSDWFANDEYSIVEVQTQLLEHFTYGILTEKGLELLKTYKNQLIHEK